MGWVREKYTRTYFTGLKEDGSRAGYGVEGFSDDGLGLLREFDVKILQKISLLGRHVLEFGFGRGESIKYAMERGVASYVGVDFAPAAIDLATEYLERNGIQPPRLYCADALEFLRSAQETIPSAIDVVIMFDFIEHVPRSELRELFSLLGAILSDHAIIVINTPVYAFDNDVVSDGVDVRNHVNAIDQSDFIEQTKGMHCNKFTVLSLQQFMNSVGYVAVSEYHVFIPASAVFGRCKIGGPIPSYLQAWREAHEAGFPVEPTYIDDDLEYAYSIDQRPSWHGYNGGLLKGIEVFSRTQYFELFGADGIVPFFANELSSGQKVFDVGSFMGLSSLLFAKLVGDTGRVISFEPNPWNIARQRLNLSHNPALAERISLYPLALGTQSGESTMIMSDDLERGYSSTSQLRTGGRTAIPHLELYEMGFQDIAVRLDTLDSFVERTGLVPDVIKLDVEGAEVDFLRGGLQTLKTYKPSLFIETHNPMAIFFVTEILRELGYSLEALEEEWGNRLQLLAKPIKRRPFENDEGAVFPKALYLLFDEHRQSLRRSNEARFLHKRIAELSVQVESLKSQPVADSSAAELSAQIANLKTDLLANSSAAELSSQIESSKSEVLASINRTEVSVQIENLRIELLASIKAADVSPQVASMKSELLASIVALKSRGSFARVLGRLHSWMRKLIGPL